MRFLLVGMGELKDIYYHDITRPYVAYIICSAFDENTP